MEENNKLIQSILTQAQNEAEQILIKAEKNIAEKNDTMSVMISKISRETDKKIEHKLQDLEKRADAAEKSEIRNQNLKNREKVNSEVTGRFREKISALIGTDEYREFVVKLVAEGAIAVDDEHANVRTSFREEINNGILRESEKLVEEKTGKKVKLSISDKQQLSSQGIIVESSNGRIAYNNQIESRLRRFDEDIKMIIINGLAKE